MEIAAYISAFCNVPERDDDTITIGESNLHLPPAIFGSDILDIEHKKSRDVLYFSAKVRRQFFIAILLKIKYRSPLDT